VSESVQTVVDAIQSEGAFELDDTAVLRILDRRHKTMVARAESYQSSAAVVAANQANADLGYVAFPTDLVHAETVVVGSARYSQGRFADLIDAYGDSRTVLLDGDGLFVRRRGTGGVDYLWIYPSVSLATSVTVFGAFRPPALTLGGTVLVDDEAVEGLMAGVFASLLMRPGEARPDLAAPQEQLFSGACDELRAREERRRYGKGPAQIRITGVNA
jgi:hypothetical protein